MSKHNAMKNPGPGTQNVKGLLKHYNTPTHIGLCLHQGEL